MTNELANYPVCSNRRHIRVQGSMTAAQASVGTAAACPTTGMILIAAEATRHGAASAPQPVRDTTMMPAKSAWTNFCITFENTHSLKLF